MWKCNRDEGKRWTQRWAFKALEILKVQHIALEASYVLAVGKKDTKTISCFCISSYFFLINLFNVHLPLSVQCNRASLQKCQTNTSFPLKALILPTCQHRNCDNEKENNDDDEKVWLLNWHQLMAASKCSTEKNSLHNTYRQRKIFSGMVPSRHSKQTDVK